MSREMEVRSAVRSILTSKQRARESFLEYCERFGEMSREEAETVARAFLKARVLTFTRHGNFKVPHGALLDRVVLRRAAGLDGGL